MNQLTPNLRRIIDSIEPPDEAAREAALARQAQLTKPAAALGRLEDLHVWAAGVFADPLSGAPAKTIVVAAADHGVAAEGVSAYPQSVTPQMVTNLLAGGAAVNVLAAQAGARVCVVDAGVATATMHRDLVVAKVGRGGGVSIHSSVPSAHLVVDVLGWFPGPSTADEAGVWSAIGRDVIDMPITYDRCYSIPYRVNPANAQTGWISDVHTAVGLIESATGIDFVYLGTSNEVPSASRFNIRASSTRW